MSDIVAERNFIFELYRVNSKCVISITFRDQNSVCYNYFHHRSVGNNIMTLEHGQVLKDRYEVDVLLGRGGMGAVYRALDTLPSKALPVALKERTLTGLPADEDATRLSTDRTHLRGSQQDSIFTRRRAAEQFKNEARLLHDIQHPNLPHVTDFFSEGENLYLVMELIQGKDLDKILEENENEPLPENEVLVWFAQVLDAIAFCHSKGIFHRDIKPANIILTPKGKTYLVDFGIARFSNDGRATTILGGTAGLSPLEQFTTRGKVDARSDIYALGASIYLLLTGLTPVPSLDRALDDTLVPPRQINPKISPHIEAAILRSVRLKPEERYANVEELKLALYSGKILSLDPTTSSSNTEQRNAPPQRSTLAYQAPPSPTQEVLRHGESSDFVSSDSAIQMKPGANKLSHLPNALPTSKTFPHNQENLSTNQTPPSQESHIRDLSPGDDLIVAIRRSLPGDTLRLRGGRYFLKDPLVIEKNLSLIGFSTQRPVIVCTGSDYVVVFKKATWLLKGIDFEYQSIRPGSVMLVDGKSIIIENCSFTGGKSGEKSKNHIGTGVEITGNTECIINNSNFTKNDLSGLKISSSADVKVKGCTLTLNGTGIICDEYSRPVVLNNICRRNNQNGIVITDNSEGQINDNRCLENKGHGIFIEKSANPILENNMCRDNTFSGIAYLDQATGSSKNNECVGNYWHGIQVMGQAHPTLDNNNCSENRNYGIYLETSLSPILKDNILKSNHRGELRNSPHLAAVSPLPISISSPSPEITLPHKPTSISNSIDLITKIKNAKSGDTLLLSPGNYQLTDTLVIEKDLNILPESEAGRIQIICSGSEPVMELRIASWKIKGIDFIHQGYLSSDVVRVNGQGIIFDDCSFSGGISNDLMQGNGLIIHNKTKVSLINCRFSRNQLNGCLVNGSGVIEINGCVFEENWKNGLDCEEAYQVKILNNQFLNNRVNGIIFNCKTGSITGNICKLNKASGILLGLDTSPTLEKNICQSNDSCGIAYINSASGVANNNTCIQNKFHGIYVASSATPNLLNNRCQENLGNGIAYMEKAAGQATNNQCLLNGTYGILVTGIAHPRLFDNSGQKNKKGGLVVEFSAKPELRNNRL